MGKTIVRPFDGLSEGPAGNKAYAMAMRAQGDFVFMMGQGGYDLDNKLVSDDDPGAQAAQACRNIRRLLAELGGAPEDLCKLTVYMTDVAYRKPIYLAIEREFRGVTLCRTGLVVSSLGPPEYLVEIDAFGVIDRAG